MSSKDKKSSYIQAFKEDINEIIKIKDAIPKLLANKVLEIQKIMNNLVKKDKPKINMTMKGPFWKQIIVSMRSNNSKRVIAKANAHATNINRLLKRVKFTISIDFICTDNKGILITTNNVASASDLNIIEKYVKELNDVDHNNIISLHLLQLKSYLKVLGISYLVEDTNLPIFSDIIKSIIKLTYIFNDIVLASKLYIIKASPKSDIVVIWIDI